MGAALGQPPGGSPRDPAGHTARREIGNPMLPVVFGFEFNELSDRSRSDCPFVFPSPHPIGRAIEQVNPIGDKPIYAPKPEQD